MFVRGGALTGGRGRWTVSLRVREAAPGVKDPGADRRVSSAAQSGRLIPSLAQGKAWTRRRDRTPKMHRREVARGERGRVPGANSQRDGAGGRVLFTPSRPSRAGGSRRAFGDRVRGGRIWSVCVGPPRAGGRSTMALRNQGVVGRSYGRMQDEDCARPFASEGDGCSFRHRAAVPAGGRRRSGMSKGRKTRRGGRRCAGQAPRAQSGGMAGHGAEQKAVPVPRRAARQSSPPPEGGGPGPGGRRAES